MIQKILKTSIFLFLAGSVSVGFAKTSQYSKLKVGKFQSRAIFGTAIHTKKAKNPIIIMIPGSGPNGPEEMMEPNLTLTNKHHSIFSDIALPLNKAGFHTLQLGKPGIEFFDPEKPGTQYYDLDMFKSLEWKDLITNLKEAITYAKTRQDVDTNRIFILGHSQGTQVAVDYAVENKDVAGLILLGYSANDVKTILEWQFYRRLIDKFLVTDVDLNHDQIISDSEAEKWPGVRFGLSDKKHEISFAEIEKIQRDSKAIQQIISQAKDALSKDGTFDRGPIYEKTLSLKIPVYVFTGALDVQTPPEESLELELRAKKAGNTNIHVTIVPDVGHGFSPPRPPRKQPLLDLTIGPVEESFQKLLQKKALLF